MELFVPSDGPPKLIEVNGRIASQFAPLVRAVQGRSTYEAMFRLACGDDPGWRALPSRGVAISYCLRVFEDALVVSVPDREPEVEILVKPGRFLSDQGTNDAESYRLAIFHEWGETRAEALARCRARAASLAFELAPARSLAAAGRGRWLIGISRAQAKRRKSSSSGSRSATKDRPGRGCQGPSLTIPGGRDLRARRPVRRGQDDGDEARQPADRPRRGRHHDRRPRASATLDAVELRRGIGYVIQQIGLFPHMTVGDNVAIVPRLLGWPRQRIRERASRS